MNERKRRMLQVSAGAIVAVAVIGLVSIQLPAGAEEAEGGAQSAREFPDNWFFYPADHEVSRELDKLVGRPVPALNLTEWINGPPDVDGKIVVVDFWATWCGPCIAAIPHTNEVAEEYAEHGVVVVGVCTSTGQEKFEQVADEHGIKYPAAKDPDSASAQAWGIRFYPTYAVVDREGIVRAIGLRPNAVENVLDRLLEEERQQQDEDS